MKINSVLVCALLLLLVSFTLAVDKSQQETTTQKNEAADAKKVEANSGDGGNYGGGGGNWGGGGGNWGGGCHRGCCYKGPWGRGGCPNCCRSAEEAKAFAEMQAGTQKP